MDGGWYDQPAGLLDRLRMLANVYNSFKSMVNTKSNQKVWSEANAEMWGIVARIERLRVEHG